VKLLLEGRPGSGKTTVARRLIELLVDKGAAVTGFTSAEIREGRGRVGFSIETVSGNKGVLAHVDFRGPSVGKYGVDVGAFEELALPSLELNDDDTVVVIDEIGKMELISDAFCEAVESLFGADNDVVATIHVHKHSFTEDLKRRTDTELVKVTRANRDDLPHEIATRLLSS
jgi:nucleoside-triphosphatase